MGNSTPGPRHTQQTAVEIQIGSLTKPQEIGDLIEINSSASQGFTGDNMADAGAISVATVFASGIVSGTVTVTTTGTTVQITATSTPIKGVWLSGDIFSGAVMVVGDSAVVGGASGMQGIVITPGNPPIFLQINDLSRLWVDSNTAGGKLCYAYLN